LSFRAVTWICHSEKRSAEESLFPALPPSRIPLPKNTKRQHKKTNAAGTAAFVSLLFLRFCV
jgi:hypothetical protein